MSSVRTVRTVLYITLCSYMKHENVSRSRENCPPGTGLLVTFATRPKDTLRVVRYNFCHSVSFGLVAKVISYNIR